MLDAAIDCAVQHDVLVVSAAGDEHGRDQRVLGRRPVGPATRVQREALAARFTRR